MTCCIVLACLLADLYSARLLADLYNVCLLADLCSARLLADLCSARLLTDLCIARLLADSCRWVFISQGVAICVLVACIKLPVFVATQYACEYIYKV